MAGCETVGEALIINVGDKELEDWDLEELQKDAPLGVAVVKVIYWYKKECYGGYGTVAYRDSCHKWHIDDLSHRSCFGPCHNGFCDISYSLSEGRTVLDPCCGGRMFYFDKHHPLVVYGDVRQESVSMTDRGKLRSLDIAPDVILDFTYMPFLDDSFNFVVFDPPHLINCGKNSWLAKKYGKLDKDSWQDTLREGLSECIRVVKPGCVVAMKWSEGDISTTKLLKALPYQPVFGDKQGKKRWLFFIKGMKGE